MSYEENPESHFLARYQDVNGHTVENHYVVEKFLGEGVFGCVYEVRKNMGMERLALKVAKRELEYARGTRTEINVLMELAQAPAEFSCLFIRLLEVFIHENQICMVFPIYSKNVYDILVHNEFRPFPVKHVKKASLQMIKALYYLHNHCNIIHTDIKPENILLDKGSYSHDFEPNGAYVLTDNINIKIADFNSVNKLDKDRYITEIAQTPNYRAPEVLLNLNWDYQVDMFSLGCVIIDMFTGHSVFTTVNVDEDSDETRILQLLNISTYCGPIPTTMMDECKIQALREMKFVDYPSCNQESVVFTPEMEAAKGLRVLIRRLMVLDPAARITSKSAYEHRHLFELE